MAGKFALALEPLDDFSGRSKVRFGVGEELGLDVLETPKVKPPTEVVAVVKSGPAAIKPSQVMGSFVLKCGNKPGAVVIEVRTKADKKVVATKRFEVVAPSGYTNVKVAKKLNGGKDGYGFVAELHLAPLDVSFKWVEKREGSAPYEGAGCFKKVQVKEIKDGMLEGEEYAVIHPVNNKWLACDGGKKQNHMRYDQITSAVPSKWAGGGKFQWSIPQFYRVKGMSGEFQFTTGLHQEVINASGMLEVSKFGVGNKIQLPPSK